MILAAALSPLLTGSGVDPAPWLGPVGSGALVLAAWLAWRQRVRLRQRWQAAYEEWHKLY